MSRSTDRVRTPVPTEELVQDGYEWHSEDTLPDLASPPSRWRRWWRAAVAVLAAVNIDFGDLLVAAGIGLVARGCYLVSPPAGWIVPGVILLWYALPPRPRFLIPPPPSGPGLFGPKRSEDGRP